MMTVDDIIRILEDRNTSVEPMLDVQDIQEPMDAGYPLNLIENLTHRD
jgi:hypothetical protein